MGRAQSLRASFDGADAPPIRPASPVLTHGTEYALPVPDVSEARVA
jgi:hypothetical protein